MTKFQMLRSSISVTHVIDILVDDFYIIFYLLSGLFVCFIYIYIQLSEVGLISSISGSLCSTCNDTALTPWFSQYFFLNDFLLSSWERKNFRWLRQSQLNEQLKLIKLIPTTAPWCLYMEVDFDWQTYSLQCNPQWWWWVVNSLDREINHIFSSTSIYFCCQQLY